MKIFKKISILLCICLTVSFLYTGNTYALISYNNSNESIIIENEYEAPYVYYASHDNYGPNRGAGDGIIPQSYITPKLPGLRNQIDGSCWAHASVALADIYAFNHPNLSENKVTHNYSESHMCYFQYNTAIDPLGGIVGDNNYMKNNYTDFYNFGGSVTYAEAVLSGWVGFADEKDYMYSLRKDYFINPPAPQKAYDSSLYLTGYKHINIKKNRDLAKKQIISHGALATNMYMSSAYHNYSTNSYFCNVSKNTNHAVTIVGWDDNYKADNFKTAPEGDGAWIIRNSYMISEDEDMSDKVWNYNGYFYLSYYDLGLSSTGYSFDFDTTNSYDRNYHYDGGLLGNNSLTVSSNETLAGNVFISKAPENGEYIKAVSFATDAVNERYEISIYRNLPNDYNSPIQGDLVSESITTGNTSFSGAYCVALKQPIFINSGEIFSVVIRLTPITAGQNVNLVYEISAPDYFSKQGTNVYAPKGTSYVFINNKFVDLYGQTELVYNGDKNNPSTASSLVNVGNLRIKALCSDNILPDDKKDSSSSQKVSSSSSTKKSSSSSTKKSSSSSTKSSSSSSIKTSSSSSIKGSSDSSPAKKTIIEHEGNISFGSYKITYDLGYDKEYITDLPVITEYTPTSNMKPIKLSKPEMKGFKFKGWYIDNKRITKITRKSNTDLYLCAFWQENTYNLKFKSGIKGQTKAVTGKMDMKKRLKYTDSYILPECQYIKPGYTFEGWSIDKNSNHITYVPGQQISKLTDKNRKTITLYAVWKKTP